MISLLPIRPVVIWIALIFSMLVVLIVLGAQALTEMSVMSSIRVAMVGSTVLNLLLLYWFYSGWQWIWARLPWLNKKFFPNLNGQWDMKISYDWQGKVGEVKATAEIHQSWTSIGIEVEAEDSDSRTLMAVPSKDSSTGRPLLYYIYLSTPHAGATNAAPYEGAATLRMGLQNSRTLSGNYFTSRGSTGRFELTRA